MSRSTNILFLLTSLFFATSVFLSLNLKHLPPKINPQLREYNFNEKLLYINLGQKRLITSLLWIKTLIDSDLEHYKNNDLNSWLFLRFKTMTDLDPKFLEVYRFGGLYLSIIKDDIEGSSFIFDRGLEKFPEDYTLNLYAGYHFYLEDKQYDKALKSFRRVLKSTKAKQMTKLIIAKLLANTQKNKEILKKELEVLIEDEDDPLFKERILKKLEDANIK